MGMGLKMAAWAGAGVDFRCAPYMTHSFGGALGCDPFLLVNERGERFCNEDVPGHLLFGGRHPHPQQGRVPDL